MKHSLTKPRASSAAILIAALLAGCSRPAEERKSPQAPSTPSHEPVVRLIDPGEFPEILAAHKGAPVLVDFWATWCPPCVELFPHTVALHRRYAERGLKVISVSMDDPSEQSAVLQFLREKGATFENYLSREGAGPASAEGFQIEDGALPQVEIYGADGKLVKRFKATSRFKAEDVEQAVASLF